jgi:hypothetical protein
MSAIEAIRERCDESAKALREALVEYRKRNASAPYALEADPKLYGDLLRHYLLWASGLLAAMQEAAAARPSASTAVDHFVARAIAYFNDSSRWPGVTSLEDPARLVIPAYYSVRAAQHVNRLFRPPLLSLDVAEAHEFAIELLGVEASDRICQHKNADLAPLARADEDQPPEKPLHYRAFLHAFNRERLAAARAATPKPPAEPPPPVASAPGGAPPWSAAQQRPTTPPAPPPIAESERVLWDRELAGTSIVLGRQNSPPDYSGSTYWSTESFLRLLPNHRFRKEVVGEMRTSYARVHALTPIHRETSGTWEVRTNGVRLSLVLNEDSGDMESLRIEKGPHGTLMVDGRVRAWLTR